jgi:hypothetical protein
MNKFLLSSYAYHLFINTCRIPVTRKQYIKGLRYFMTYLGLPLDAYDKLLDKDPKHIQMNVCDFVVNQEQVVFAS